MRTVDEIKEYIAGEKKAGFRYGSKRRNHDLVPSFELANRSAPIAWLPLRSNSEIIVKPLFH